MKCKTIQSQMGALLDEQLSAVERLNIISHFQECDSCKQQFDQLKLIQQELALMPTPELSHNFEIGLADKIRAFEQEKHNKTKTAKVIQLNQNPASVIKKPKSNALPLFIAAAAVATLTWINFTTFNNSETTIAQSPTLLTATPEALAALDLQIKNNAEIEIESLAIAASFEPTPISTGAKDQQEIYWSDVQANDFDQFTQIDDGYQSYNCGSSNGERGCALSDSLTIATLPIVTSI